MKLRNKKTGEIIDLNKGSITDVGLGSGIQLQATDRYNKPIWVYNSLAELNEEWEDVPKEPKSFWTINTTFDCAEPIVSVIEISERYYNDKDAKSIGNYFETKEEAEKAVEKLKAWKRLKDKGFMFDTWYGGNKVITFSIPQEIIDEPTAKDLDLLFGGEE